MTPPITAPAAVAATRPLPWPNWFPTTPPEDVELGDVEVLAAKYPDVAADLRTFPIAAKD
jgi:hypothetical protein